MTVVEFPQTLLGELGIDPQLAFQFFTFFSRFEFGLKNSNFLIGDAEGAQPDWDKFSSSVKGTFRRADSEVREAILYIVSKPPQVQTVRDRGIHWVTREQGPGESEEHYVLRLVRYVRNNLFHGGKYRQAGGPIQDVGRDRKLLEASLVILNKCLALNSRLGATFLEAA